MPAVTVVRSLFRYALLFLMSIVTTASAAAPEIDVKVEKRDDTFFIDSTFEVPVTQRTAWRVLVDFDNMTNILHNLTSSRIVSRNGNTLQVKQEGIARFGVFSYTFTSEREIRLEPRKRILVRQISGNTKHYASEMEIIPGDNGTRFRYHAEMALDSTLGKLFGRPFIEHEIAEQFTAMAAEMERRQTPQ